MKSLRVYPGVFMSFLPTRVPSTIALFLCFINLEMTLKTNFQSIDPDDKTAIRYEAACNRIAIEAVKRGSSDNVSVMLVDITKH